MRIDITILSNSWQHATSLRQICQRATVELLNELQAFYSMPIRSEISLLFTNNSHIQSLNAEWRGKKCPTNVLSFPAQKLKVGQMPGRILGDIIFAYETIEAESCEQGKNFYEHLVHLFIHGCLHLLGFTHSESEKAEQMEAIEANILRRLNIKNPYDLA